MARSSKDPAASLRHVPPREFIAARKALAERLGRSGRSDEARQVSRLPRPSPVVWALNQAALGKARMLIDLVHAVDRLRRAQLGQGDPRAATAAYRTVFDAVMEAARGVLREQGMKASPAVERRLRSSLLAAVTDRRLRGELAAGRLAVESVEPGFSVLSGGPIPAEFLKPSATGRPVSRPAPPDRDVAGRGRARRPAAASGGPGGRRRPRRAGRRRTPRGPRSGPRRRRPAPRPRWTAPPAGRSAPRRPPRRASKPCARRSGSGRRGARRCTPPPRRRGPTTRGRWPRRADRRLSSPSGPADRAGRRPRG